MKSKAVFINDLHFGLSESTRILDELNKIFIPFIEKEDLDIIFFGGDFFELGLALGSQAARQAIDFFTEVSTIAERKHIKIRIIEGTLYHDRFQPRILENCLPESSTLDYKYYETVDEEILNGIKILYVPEEYPLDDNDYYGKYKEKQYDLMLVHGVWDFINFSGMIDNGRTDINTAPVFKYDEWKTTLEHGVSLCGHIHSRHGFKTKDGTKIIYPGSFSAWSFDRISERGFLYFEIDPENHSFEYKFINNTLCPKYANLNLDDLGIDLNVEDVESLKNRIAAIKEKVDFIKVDITNLSEEKQLILREFYKTDDSIKVEYTKKRVFLENSENVEKYKKYDYLLDGKLPISAALQRFIKEETGTSIDESTIKEIIKEA